MRSQNFKHYRDDKGDTDDRRLIQPKGRETFRKLEHKTAEITREQWIECRPVDMVTDPKTAEVAKWALEYDVYQPHKRFRRELEKAVKGGLSARVWFLEVDWDRRLGPFGGDTTYHAFPFNGLYWTPGWDSPHDPTCPWVMRVKTMRMDTIQGMAKQGWKNTGDVRADEGNEPARQGGDPSLPPGQVRMQSQATDPQPGRSKVMETATVCLVWYRFSDEMEKVPDGDPARLLAPEKRYYACAKVTGGCGYVAPQAQDLELAGDDQSMPAEGPPCPKCGQPLQRIDYEVPAKEVLAYPNGRLTIVAPFSDVTLYDGKWPWKIRSVPYFVFKGYEHSRDVIGPSDTSVDWSFQTISNALLRMAYEQMATNRDVTIVSGDPEKTLVDAAGEPWVFSDQPGGVAFYNGTLPLSQAVFHSQGSGIPPGWNLLFSSVQSMFMRDMGTADIALGQQNTKDIPVGTLQALQQQGEIPVRHAKERMWDELSVFLGVVLDILRANWTEERMVRLRGQDGAWAFRALKGMDIPNADVIVSAAPATRDVHPEQIAALNQVLTAPPPYRKVLAKAVHMDPADLAQVEEDDPVWQEFVQFKQQQAAAQQLAAKMGAQPGGGMPPRGMGAMQAAGQGGMS